jgi:hypothetical protein
MTLTYQILAEFRRAEKESPVMTLPPGGRDAFEKDLPEYLQRIKAEAGPHPATWDPDCEAHAAMDLLKDILEIRRAKLVRAAEFCNPPTFSHQLTFESNAWFGWLDTYKRLDKAIDRMTIEGVPGKWE